MISNHNITNIFMTLFQQFSLARPSATQLNRTWEQSFTSWTRTLIHQWTTPVKNIHPWIKKQPCTVHTQACANPYVIAKLPAGVKGWTRTWRQLASSMPPKPPVPLGQSEQIEPWKGVVLWNLILNKKLHCQNVLHYHYMAIPSERTI